MVVKINKIIIFGASGNTGQATTDYAMKAGKIEFIHQM